MAFRRPSPCKRCRIRHHACFTESPDYTGECLACRRAGVVCEAQNGSAIAASRSVNTTAELRAISLRVGAVIDSLQDAEPENRGDGAEVDDLVERLTAVVFTNDGLDRPNLTDVADEAFDVMAAGSFFEESDMDSGGFIWAENPNDITVEELISSLPPWQQVEELLLQWPSQWQSQVDACLLPTWPRRIEKLYKSNFSPLPHPHVVAELLAWLALQEANTAVMISRRPELRPKLRQNLVDAERYIKLSFDALNSDGSVMENPTFEAIRTLQMLAGVYIGCWVDHSRLRKGLAILPFAISLAHQLGYNRADVDFDGESPARRYERKAVVLAMVRMMWNNNPLIARKSAYSPASILFGPANDLDPDCVPRDPKYHGWMPAWYTLKSLDIRSRCAMMRYEIQMMVNKGTKCDYKAVTAYATRIARQEGELFPLTWQPYEDPSTHQMTIPPIENKLERTARFLAIPVLQNLGLSLHRAFLTSTSNSGSVDSNWHRRELVLACRKQWTAVAEGRDVVGGFLSIWCACWDIAICAALLLSPAHLPYLSEGEQGYCNQVVAYCMDRYKHSGFPHIYRNLARLISFVLCRLHPSLPAEEPTPKRTRKDSSTGPLGVPWDQLPMPDGEPKLDLDFTFTAPLHLQFGEGGDDLVHLQPSATPMSSVPSDSMSTDSFLQSLSRSMSSRSSGDGLFANSKVF